jgi:NADPH:quinone reductase-like Zn-dependent oxidoreductase
MSTAITFARYGTPDVLTVSPTEVPQPGPGQVRIRVHAVAVNLIDVKIRSGHMDGIFPITLPLVPGWDVAGVVDAVGENAPGSIGDEVFGVASTGGCPSRRACPGRSRPPWSPWARPRSGACPTWASRPARRC